MRALNETEKYLNSIEEQEEVKEKDTMEDILGKMVDTFSGVEAALKNMEEVMKALNIGNPEAEEENSEPNNENEGE